jgi:hypothetical protein
LTNARLLDPSRRVTVKARVVRHRGRKFRSVSLSAHLAYLKREGVNKDGEATRMFDSSSDTADEKVFAERCKDDRHHFRFIVSPEDAADLADLKAFARDHVTEMEHDLGTKLDWIGVDHWNTDNPHIHLLNGRTDDESDLVISRDYIRRGIRARSEQLVTLELGPKNDAEIRSALEREVEAERWTRLDAAIRREAADDTGVIDLRPSGTIARDLQVRRLMSEAADRRRSVLAARSDLAITAQVTATGATWLDYQLVARERTTLASGGFGAEVREALGARIEYLTQQGFARRQGQRVIFANDLLGTLRRRELDEVTAQVASQTGLSHRPPTEGDSVSGTYSRRLNLASGRFAMIDDGLGFSLVPWRPALERRIGQHVSGTVSAGGATDWDFSRKRGLEI